jgi:opacity protein-like surface antigen
VDDLAIDGGPAWGAQATWFVSPHVGVEGLWTSRSTSMSMSTTAVTTDLFSMTTHQFLANIVYQFRQAETNVRPFVFGGVGATVLDGTDLASETKAAWTVGGGVKWFPQRHVGVKTQARYTPTVLSDTSSTTCDPFGYCQGLLNQLEIAAGVVLRF